MPFDGKGFDFGITARDVDILRTARDRVARPDGWIKLNLRDGNGRCAMGELADAMLKRGRRPSSELSELSNKTLVPVLDDPERWKGLCIHPGWAVSSFNDH